MRTKAFLIVLISFWFLPVHAQPPQTVDKTPNQTLLEIQKELIELDRQFEVIRQDLFFPKDEEVLFYLRNEMKEGFPVKTLELFINGKKVHTHNYTDAEKVAFNFSGLQPLSRFELKPGNYQITARLTLLQAKIPVREHRFTLEKQDLPRFVEIAFGLDKKTKDYTMAEKIW